MADYQEANYLDQRTPVQCRNGPLQERSCTDCCCCLIYIILIAAVAFLGIFSAHSQGLKRQAIEQQLDQAQFGKPLLSISQAFIPIILSLAFVTALSFLLVITTFLIPSIVAYIYIPLFLILMLLISIIFFIRYFGQEIPLLDKQKQNKWVQSKSIWTLIIAIAFAIAFLAAIITICSKRGKFKNIVPPLQMAKICFWQNCHLIFASFFLSILSIGTLAVNIIILAVSQTRQSGQQLIDSRILGVIIIIQALWTHGFLQALSDFYFESIAIHWYFNKRKQIDGQEGGCCTTLCQSIKLIIKHIGTIVYGHILAYVPQTLNTMLGRCQNNCNCLYSVLCCFHKYTFNHLTKYCYIQTILQSYAFCPANTQMFGLRKRTKATLPEIYMMGNFYITLAKIFITVCSLCLTYILIAQLDHELMKNMQNVIAPMVITFFGSLQIAGHFMNTTGLIGDTIAFMYTADLEIEKKHFGQMFPYSCPQQIEEIIHNIKIGQIQDDEN